jgi:NitT/TauT family transport system substrate-binding protein
MLSGETPFAVAGEDAIINADVNGGDIVILAGGPEKLFFTVYAAPNIHSVADLKGKRLGVTQFGTTTDFIAHYVLKKANLKPTDDVAIIPMGVQANILTGVLSGVIDGGVLGSDVILKAQQLAAYNPLVAMIDDELNFYTYAFAGKKSWMRDHPADTLNVMRGYLAGIAATLTNKQSALAAVGKYTKTTDQPALESAYALLIKTLPKVPVPKPAALQADLDQSTRPEIRNADPSQFIDASVIDQLQREHFIDSLYK